MEFDAPVGGDKAPDNQFSPMGFLVMFSTKGD
jgi:hypothetical protein